ncbi:bifunctional folylpolyglutamate synthase/dihydrofolate synthase [Lutimonas zeaxanthinifaciens]|uniref:bifunctional folylpolyglutamate synthase/dihydrofolate synthase n=1 Tax=Lutimonas zeaxanthinifaciens TaxID=3060215 RepID=UPI00265CB176|nr:folylpolyglutamate synthase/dihydrofolate synthase family protein [Lutimonas sp. YSD2104]WKK65374.1 folylpolyglutamate synthase/dihydrofolate synthase family protein [Lutimonas sp. YSD2104]
MNYAETLAWMFSRLPMYQRQGSTAFKKDLTNIKAFCEHLGNPHLSFKSIHVAGTNGKGSTSHMISSVLQTAGYKTGLYTSPHLKDFRERIRIDGVPVDQQWVVHFIDKHKRFLEQQGLSFFELTVGMAFEFFASQKVDIAVVEVGLGGRLDSTNILNPLISVITNIGLDHTQFLGETHEEIAFEKGGIIKENIPVIIGEFQRNVMPVFKEIAGTLDAPIYIAEHLVNDPCQTDLLGFYQQKNCKTAVQALSLLKDHDFDISDDQIIQGLLNVASNTGLKGRWQILGTNPKIVCDTAHNREGLAVVMDQLSKEKYKNLHIVLGVVNDKDLGTILSLFPKKATYYFCKPDIPRGLNAEDLKNQSKEFNLLGDVFDSVSSAFNSALLKASSKDFIYVGGSTFVVAELDL